MKRWPRQIIPTSMTLNLKSNSKSFESSLNNSSVTVGFMGARWVASLSFDSLDNFEEREIEILQSFVWSLQGMNGKFKMWNFTKQGSPAKGNPLVAGFDNSGSILETKGWTPNRQVLSMGDFIEFNGELKMVTEDIRSDNTGRATLIIVPPIRNIPADNEPLITDYPSGTFRLTDDDQGSFDLTAGIEGTLTLDVVEAIYVQ